MTVRDFVNTLCEEDFDKPIQFYFLKNYDLKGCELFNIQDIDGRVEITIVGEDDAEEF